MVTFRAGPDVQASMTGETAPKGKPKGGPTARPIVSNRSLKAEISGLLMTLNLALMLVPPLRSDALDEVEIEAMAQALDEECKRSLRFRRMMEAALSAGSGGTLIGVMAIIGARRAVRHNVLPGGLESDQLLGNMLAKGMQASNRARAAAGIG